MATIPAVPNFVLFDNSLQNLQDLSACVAFGCQTPVAWKFYATANQSFSAATNAQIEFQAKALDTDGVYGGSGSTAGEAVIVTPGYYDIELGVQITNYTASDPWAIWVLLTTGANNPQYGSGFTMWLANIGDYITGQSSIGQGIASFDTTPCLWPGDTLACYFYCAAAVTSAYAQGASGNVSIGGNPDTPVYFSGRLASLGP